MYLSSSYLKRKIIHFQRNKEYLIVLFIKILMPSEQNQYLIPILNFNIVH